VQPDVNSHTCFCRFEDYVGQLEAATAIAGLSVEKGRTVGIKDRKDIAAVQEVCLHLLALVVQLGTVWSKITIVAVWHGYAWCPSVFCISQCFTWELAEPRLLSRASLSWLRQGLSDSQTERVLSGRGICVR